MTATSLTSDHVNYLVWRYVHPSAQVLPVLYSATFANAVAPPSYLQESGGQTAIACAPDIWLAYD